jgi:hypothetical protein
MGGGFLVMDNKFLPIARANGIRGYTNKVRLHGLRKISNLVSR